MALALRNNGHSVELTLCTDDELVRLATDDASFRQRLTATSFDRLEAELQARGIWVGYGRAGDVVAWGFR